jgi:ribosomal subunit interface protein
MKTIIVARKFEVTDDLKKRLEKKLAKLDKFFSDQTTANVTMSSERGRDKLELTIVYKSTLFRAEVVESEMITAIDHSIGIIERQILKNKSKLESRFHTAFGQPDEAPDIEEEGEYKITRVKKFPIKPMSTEEAILQMNLSGHEFFLFRNDTSEEINLVYKKKNNEYGLIEPVED